VKIISPEKEDLPPKEDQTPKTQRLLSHKKEEGNLASIQGELATSEEERQVKNEELFGGSQDCDPRSHGQHDEAPEQKGQKRQEMKEPLNDALENARTVLKFCNTHNSEIYIEPHLSMAKFDAIYRPKVRETYDVIDEREPSKDIIDAKDVRRPTDDLRVVNNNILIDVR
jgi:hypothetical protein